MIARRELSAASPVGREVDLVAAGAEVRRESAPDLRLVVDDEDRGSRAGLAAAGSTVRPPPGVSSISRSPPIASTNPFATARPRPTPSRGLESPSRWNGQEHPLALRGGTPGPWSITPHVDAGRRRRPASMRGGVSGGRVRRRVRDHVRERPLEQRRRRRAPGGRVSGSVEPDVRRAVPRLRERRGQHLVEADGSRWTSSAPVWSRLMSSRLPTRPLRRSVSSSIVARNSAAPPRSIDVVLEQTRDRGLDRGERRAQVVRDGREDRGAQLVRGGEAPGRRRLCAELLGLRSTRPARRANASRTRRSSAARCPASPRGRARASASISTASVARPSGLGRLAGGRLDAPAVARRDAVRRRPRGRTRAGGLASDLLDRRRTGKPREAAGLGPGARPLGGRRAASATKALTTRRRRRRRQREQVLALADRERVERRREVPVDEQEAPDGDGERRPDAADGGDGDDEQQEEQENARERHVVAELCEQPGEQRRGQTAPRAKPSATRRRGRALGRRRLRKRRLRRLRRPD